MKITKDYLLNKYKRVWDKIDDISKRTDDIIKVSAMGQAPPIFHALLDKQCNIIKKDAEPLWDELKRFVRADFQTYWQYTGWIAGTMPPHFNELGEVV